MATRRETFNEHDRTIRVGQRAENFSRLCRIALNSLKQDKALEAGINGKRVNAEWDNNYLLKLISA